jgi:hypothetical protein
LDAEGEEVNILLGRRRFLVEQSPLIMFEFMHGASVNDDLIAEFMRNGWGLYRLPCAHGFLVPFDPKGPVELNLFACKPDRAVHLAQQGVLASSNQPASDPPEGIGLALLRRQSFAERLGSVLAQNALALDLGFARSFDAYGVWRDTARSPAERYAALLLAQKELEALLAHRATLPRRSTYARVAWEAGLPNVAVEVLTTLIDLGAHEKVSVTEPFWPAVPRFDSIDPGGDVVGWCVAAAIYQLERLRAASSFFAGLDTLPLLDWLHASRFALPEMERRRALIYWRAHRPLPDTLSEALPDNLNPNLWRNHGVIAAQLANVPREH